LGIRAQSGTRRATFDGGGLVQTVQAIVLTALAVFDRRKQRA
jgi:hypothetical protein